MDFLVSLLFMLSLFNFGVFGYMTYIHFIISKTKKEVIEFKKMINEIMTELQKQK